MAGKPAEDPCLFSGERDGLGLHRPRRLRLCQGARLDVRVPGARRAGAVLDGGLRLRAQLPALCGRIFTLPRATQDSSGLGLHRGPLGNRRLLPRGASSHGGLSDRRHLRRLPRGPRRHAFERIRRRQKYDDPGNRPSCPGGCPLHVVAAPKDFMKFLSALLILFLSFSSLSAFASEPLSTLELLKELVRIDTSNPPGNETAAARFIQDYL